MRDQLKNDIMLVTYYQKYKNDVAQRNTYKYGNENAISLKILTNADATLTLLQPSQIQYAKSLTYLLTFLS